MTQCAADIRVAWLVYLLVYVSTYCVPITTLNQNKQNSITLFGRRPNNLHRRVTQPKRVTSPTWGAPPPCKQALRSAKQQLFTCITLFCTISLPSLHVYDMKLPNFTSYGGREHKTTIFFFFWESDRVL